MTEKKEYRMPPNPIDETITWCQKHKPDATPHVQKINDLPWSNPQTQALELLIAISFAAGRQYQHDNPEHTALLAV